jgi:hypothetical protein
MTYRQIDGMAMGNPLGPIFADIFLSFYEEKWLHECPIDFKPIFYRRYVDDTFVAFKHKDHVPKFHAYINDKHTCLRFTYEVESNGLLPFIGIMVSKRDDLYHTGIFHKPTNTDLFTNFNTFAPTTHKLAAVRSLCHRAINICSSYKEILKELDSLTKRFQRNHYPKSILHKLMSTMFNQQYSCNFDRTIAPTVKPPKLIFCTKFYGRISLFLSKQLKRLCHQFFKIPGKSIIFSYNTFKMKSLFKYKEALPDALHASVVYKFQCSSCNATYVGQTARHLHTRISEHLGVSSTTGQPIKTNSTIFDHIYRTGHRVDPNNFSILCTARNRLDLPILEQYLIGRHKPNLNRQSDFSSLYLI